MVAARRPHTLSTMLDAGDAPAARPREHFVPAGDQGGEVRSVQIWREGPPPFTRPCRCSRSGAGQWGAPRTRVTGRAGSGL
jgi:hypothetical protein